MTDTDKICRVMAEKICDSIILLFIYPNCKDETIGLIYKAIRNHTAYPDCIGALEEALPALHSDKRQRVDNALAKARKP